MPRMTMAPTSGCARGTPSCAAAAAAPPRTIAASSTFASEAANIRTGAGGPAERVLQPSAFPIMQFEQRVARAHLVARLGQDDDADRRIDAVVDAVAAGAERDRRAADGLRVEPRQKSAARRGHQMRRR